MRAGINLKTEQIFIELGSNGLSSSSEMDANTARLLAAQLTSAADNLDEYTRKQTGKENQVLYRDQSSNK